MTGKRCIGDGNRFIGERCRRVCDTGRMTPEEAREQERSALEEFSQRLLDEKDLDEAFEGEQLLSETITTSPMSPLSVHVDVCELLDMFEKDESRLWEFLGKLKDLFA
jgi:hypothetical protein